MAEVEPGCEPGPERERRALIERVARAWLSAPRCDSHDIGASADAVLAMLESEGRLRPLRSSRERSGDTLHGRALETALAERDHARAVAERLEDELASARQALQVQELAMSQELAGLRAAADEHLRTCRGAS